MSRKSPRYSGSSSAAASLTQSDKDAIASRPVTQAWAANTAVKLEELRYAVLGGAVCTLRSTAARTTRAALDVTELGFWRLVGQDRTPNWDWSEYYIAGQRVLGEDGGLRERISSGQASNVWVESEWIRLAPIASASGLQLVGEFVPPANTIYDTLATVTTGIDFSKCDYIEWTFRNTTSQRAITSWVPVVIGGTTPTMEASHGAGQISSFIANATDAAAGKLTNIDCHGIAFHTLAIRGWARPGQSVPANKIATLTTAAAGATVPCGSLQVRIPSTGNKALQITSVASTATVRAQGVPYWAPSAGTDILTLSLTAGAWVYPHTTWNYASVGNTSRHILYDDTANRRYVVNITALAGFANYAYDIQEF